jgi:glycosyltransferase involved in cell wall biosynthesis
MHILEVPSFFQPHGGLFCLEQAKALKNLGHEVRIMTNVQLGITVELHDYFMLPYRRYVHEMDGITIYQSYQRGLPKGIQFNAKRWVTIVRNMFEQYVKKYGQPDIIHAHCAKWAGYAAMLISQDYDIPYVITEHLSKTIFDDEFRLIGSNPWQIPLLSEAYQHAAKVLSVSEELPERLSVYFGKGLRWKTVSNIVDTDFYQYKQRKPLQGRAFQFCCLANFIPLKGYDILFSAFSRLRKQGMAVELHIAGRGTDTADCRSQLTNGMFTHGLIDRQAVRELLYASDALVLASRSEAQPLVLLEAMSTGIPVVSTEVIPQNLRLKGGCFIVPIDNADLLAEAMKHVVETLIDGQQISQQVAQLASARVVGEKLDKVFREAVADTTPHNA